MTSKELKTIRGKLKITQGELANLLGYKTYHSINAMEAGRRVIPQTVAMVVSQMNQHKFKTK